MPESVSEYRIHCVINSDEAERESAVCVHGVDQGMRYPYAIKWFGEMAQQLITLNAPLRNPGLKTSKSCRIYCLAVNT